MKYHAPYGSTDPDAPYVDRNTPGAIRGSAVPAAAVEYAQREIVRVLTDRGITPTDTDLGQLSKAITADIGGVDRVVKGRQAAPPGAPANGDRYVVLPGGVGAWAGHDNEIALAAGVGWLFDPPTAGLQVQYYSGRQIVLIFTGTGWTEDMGSETAPGRLQLSSDSNGRVGTRRDVASSPAAVAAAMEQFGLFGNSFHCEANIDVDTLQKNGEYWVSTQINGPAELVSFLLDVSQVDNAFIRQTAYSINSNLIYTRLLFPGGKTAWRPINADASMSVKGLINFGTVRDLAIGNAVYFVVPGTTSWVVPEGINRLRIKVRGGGGGGGGSANTSGTLYAGTGGGGGGFAGGTLVVSPGQIIPITVGAGGDGGAPLSAGSVGGSSSAGSVTSATGGGGGLYQSASNTYQISGGVGSGEYQATGGNGGIVIRDGSTGNALGGSGGVGANGGGQGGVSSSALASPGGAPGGGGGGGGGPGGFPGGVGAPGLVIIEY